MKKLIKNLTGCVTAIVLLFSLVAQSQQTKLSGTITGSLSSRIKIVNVSYNGNEIKIPVNAEKQFSKVLDLKTPQFITFSVGSQNNSLYAVPGKPITLSLERNDYKNPVGITRSEKDLEAIDNVIQTFNTSLENQGIKVSGKNWLADAIDNPKAIDVAVKDAKVNYMANAKTIDKVAPNFKKDLDIMGSTFKSYVAIDGYSLEQLEAKLKNVSKSNMKFSDMALPYYSEYINDLTTAYAVRKLDSYMLDLEPANYRLGVARIAAEVAAENLANPDVKNMVFHNLIDNEMKRYGISREGYLNYLFNHVDKNSVADLQKTYNDIIAKGNMDGPRKDLIPFTVYDVNGGEHTMDEFLGKMVYIDFWASWCAPCKMQIPYIKKLEEQYKGKDIVFVGISFDAKKDAWLKSVEEEGLHGDTFWAEGDFKHPLATTYGIKSIPRFMLLDMDGKIMSDDIVRPSQTDELTEVINKELYKKELHGIVENHIKKIGGDKLMKGIGVEVATNASVMGIEIMANTYYEYPSKVRLENFQMGSKDRSDKSNMKFLVVDLKKAMEEGNASMLAKVSGFEVFLLAKEFGKKFEFAPENFSNEDNEHVLQTPVGGNMVKVFIGKDDSLLHKIMMESPVSARKGGGTSASTSIYSDYKEVNGVYVPYKRSFNGMLTTTVDAVNVENLDDSLFVTNDEN